jgi:hypothetical protein
LGEKKRAGGLSSLLCLAVYGLGSFMNGKEKEALQQGLAPHTLSHSATERTGMISSKEYILYSILLDQQIKIYAN